MFAGATRYDQKCHPCLTLSGRPCSPVEQEEVIMSFSDLFKKSPKKDTAASAANDKDVFSPEMQKKRYDAAIEFLENFQQRMPLVGGKPHPGTVLSVVGRLGGTSLYRSLYPDKNLPPGVAVLSEEVNEAWPELMRLFAFYCNQNGFDVMSKPMVTQFPEKDKPLMNVEQVLQEYQDEYHEIMRKHQLDYRNGARAGMVVASMIFQYHCVKDRDIDPYVAAGLVAMGIVEGAKTAPPPLGAKPKTGTKKMSRLVLGEPDAVREEALATGAIYIELNPEIAKRLKSGGIDPYIIYEEGVRKQIDERIARIDFVKVDVDALYEEWRSKSYTNAPIHVRLIIWLKNNASTHGYEQSGNSWVLR
jgi:hypothetical protein